MGLSRIPMARNRRVTAAPYIPSRSQVAWGVVPGECFSNLLRNPFRRRVGGHIDPDKLPPGQPNDHQDVEQVEADGRDHEEI